LLSVKYTPSVNSIACGSELIFQTNFGVVPVLSENDTSLNLNSAFRFCCEVLKISAIFSNTGNIQSYFSEYSFEKIKIQLSGRSVIVVAVKTFLSFSVLLKLPKVENSFI